MYNFNSGEYEIHGRDKGQKIEINLRGVCFNEDILTKRMEYSAILVKETHLLAITYVHAALYLLIIDIFILEIIHCQICTL